MEHTAWKETMIGRPHSRCSRAACRFAETLSRAWLDWQEQEERELLQIGGVSRSNKRDTGDEGGSRYYDAAVEPVKQAAHQPDGHDATQGEGKQGDTQFPFVDSGLTFDGGNT